MSVLCVRVFGYIYHQENSTEQFVNGHLAMTEVASLAIPPFTRIWGGTGQSVIGFCYGFALSEQSFKELCSGSRIRTCDLEIMRLTR